MVIIVSPPAYEPTHRIVWTQTNSQRQVIRDTTRRNFSHRRRTSHHHVPSLRLGQFQRREFRVVPSI